ncbi:DUF1493 family protein [Candidatus Curtissbacteria bacterium]|nr:DUF1493 family protein [Candidatus Curtissbacteria bacterium]
MADFLEDIKKIISQQFGIAQEEIEEDSRLDEDLSITDLDLEDLIGLIQEKYDIEIPAEKLHSFKKVSDIVSFLYENVSETGEF